MGGLAKSKSCLQLSSSGEPRVVVGGGGGRRRLLASSAPPSASAAFPGELVPTSLFLPPVDEHEGDEGNDANSTNGGGGGRVKKRGGGSRERLYLPRRGSAPCSLDEYLKNYVPRVASRAEDLLESEEDEALLADENDDGGECECGDGDGKGGASGGGLGGGRRNASFLNVLQGEVAHATPSQADVVVSADATTCHVVALRSTSCGGVGDPSSPERGTSESPSPSPSQPLVSVAHVDAPGTYDACLDAMVREHIEHHGRSRREEERKKGRKKLNSPPPSSNSEAENDDFGFFFDDESDDDGDDNNDNNGSNAMGWAHPPSPPSFLPRLDASASSVPTLDLRGDVDADENSENDEDKKGPIEMELHMVGGYLDSQGTSQDISTSLLNAFSDVAERYRDKVRLTLSSAAVSCMNTSVGDESAKPRGRGLGIDTRTGRVFPLKSSLPKRLEGPAVDVRSARAFALDDDATAGAGGLPRPRSLAVIHDAPKSSISGESRIKVEPFEYEPNPQLDVLLQIPDDILLKVASTSPESESAGFCAGLRRTVSFVNTVPRESVFGGGGGGGAAAADKPLVYTRSRNNLNEWERV